MITNSYSILDHLNTSLPPVFPRTDIDKLMLGMMKAKTQANIDSAGEGPPLFKNGRRVFYEKKSYLKWFSKRIKANKNV